jgi:hypothetical protein
MYGYVWGTHLEGDARSARSNADSENLPKAETPVARPDDSVVPNDESETVRERSSPRGPATCVPPACRGPEGTRG